MADLEIIRRPEIVHNGSQNGEHNGRSNGQSSGQTNGHANSSTNGELNGESKGKSNGRNDAQLHGGIADGLPVSVPGNGGSAGPNGVEADAIALAVTTQKPEAASEQIVLLAGDELVPLTSVLESLLFVAREPVEIPYLAKSLGLKPAEVEGGLQLLAYEFKERGGGMRVQVHNGRYQLVTAPVTASFVEDFLNVDISAKLSSAALESLAIIAYRQPVTRNQIEAVRGVDCSGVLRSLTARGLIEELGRQDVVGRPILYGVTELFMQSFGLTELGELPPLGEEDADILHAATELAEEPDTSDAADAVTVEPYPDFASRDGGMPIHIDTR